MYQVLLKISCFWTWYIWLPATHLKPDTFDSLLSFSSFVFDRKTEKTVPVWKSSINKKNEISESELSVWFIQLSTYFNHTVRFTTIYHFNTHTHTHTYIYIYIYNLALNKPQMLIRHKTPTDEKYFLLYFIFTFVYSQFQINFPYLVRFVLHTVDTFRE